MNMLLKSLTTTCEGIGMIHYVSNKSTISFSEYWKYILTESSRIAGKVGHYKVKKFKEMT